MAYSKDLRQRIVTAVLERKMTIAEAAKTFQVGTATVERYLKRYRETGDLTPRTSPGRPSGLTEREDLLKKHLVARNDLRLENHCKQWKQATGKHISSATMSRWLKRINITRKKDTRSE